MQSRRTVAGYFLSKQIQWYILALQSSTEKWLISVKYRQCLKGVIHLTVAAGFFITGHCCNHTIAPRDCGYRLHACAPVSPLWENGANRRIVSRTGGATSIRQVSPASTPTAGFRETSLLPLPVGCVPRSLCLLEMRPCHRYCARLGNECSVDNSHV